jgi:AmiR/NasT family two-component response regulator
MSIARGKETQDLIKQVEKLKTKLDINDFSSKGFTR